MKKASAVIPAYNEEEGIQSTLEDLNRQTSRDFEVIVVDNNSTDHTVEIVKNFSAKAKYPLKILNESQPGVGHARKKGADDAISRGVSILVGTDADCDIEPGWIDGIIASFADDTVSAVTGKLIWSLKRLALIIEPLKEEIKKKLVYLFKLNNFIVEHTIREPLISGINFGIKTDVYIRVGGFTQPYFEGKPAPREDWELGYKLEEFGYKTVFAKTDNPTNPRRILQWLIAEDNPDIIYKKTLTHIRPKEFVGRLNQTSDERIRLRLRKILLFQVFSPILSQQTAKPERAEWFLGERITEFIDDCKENKIETLEKGKARFETMERFLDKYSDYIIARVEEKYLKTVRIKTPY